MDENADKQPGPEERPSRSQQRRDALAVLELATRLAALPAGRLQALDLPVAVADELERVRKITAHGARKRQLAYLAKMLRKGGEETLDAVHAACGDNRGSRLREQAAGLRIEALGERLLSAGDAALAEVIEAHPAADRQTLRNLVRNARRQRQSGKAGHAMRDLLRALRALESAR